MEMAIRTVHMPWYFFCRTIDPIYMCYTYSPRATNRECVWASVVITQIIRALNGTKRGHNSFIECLPNDVWTHLSGIFARYKNGEKNVTNVRAASMICSMCLGLFSTPILSSIILLFYFTMCNTQFRICIGIIGNFAHYLVTLLNEVRFAVV